MRAAALVLAAASASATPNLSDTREKMALRYADFSKCMALTLGSGWQSRYQIDMVINQWGSAEPSELDMAAAPQTIRVVELQCRRELGLSGVPRAKEPVDRAEPLA